MLIGAIIAIGGFLIYQKNNKHQGVDDTVSKGDNILKYTDGTYLVSNYDCVIISTNLPDTQTKATSSNYIKVSNLDTLNSSLSISEKNKINCADLFTIICFYVIITVI